MIFHANTLAQQSVTLVSVGSGVTADQARTDALRNAIEQTYGVFISSNTEILNDEIVKDEIVTISSGNIENFDVLNEEQINETLYTSNLRVTVSVTKLTSYVQSKGQEIEFSGGLFAQNIKLQQLNEENEIKVISDMINVLNSFKYDLFDYKVEVTGEPKNYGGESGELWELPLTINGFYNQNASQIDSYVFDVLSSISMSEDEISEYERLGKNIWRIILVSDKNKNTLTKIISLRRKVSLRLLLEYIIELENLPTKWSLKLNGTDEEWQSISFENSSSFHEIYQDYIYERRIRDIVELENYISNLDLLQRYYFTRDNVKLKDYLNYLLISNQSKYDVNRNRIKAEGTIFENLKLTSKYVLSGKGLLVSFANMHTGNPVFKTGIDVVIGLDRINKLTGFSVGFDEFFKLEEPNYRSLNPIEDNFIEWSESELKSIQLPRMKNEDSNPIVHYPREAILLGYDYADVELEFIINEQGLVEEPRVVQENYHGFDKHALRYLKEYTFEPATLKGKPIKIKAKTTIYFRDGDGWQGLNRSRNIRYN
jgi:hypothetical protein